MSFIDYENGQSQPCTAAALPVELAMFAWSVDAWVRSSRNGRPNTLDGRMNVRSLGAVAQCRIIVDSCEADRLWCAKLVWVLLHNATLTTGRLELSLAAGQQPMLHYQGRCTYREILMAGLELLLRNGIAPDMGDAETLRAFYSTSGPVNVRDEKHKSAVRSALNRSSNLDDLVPSDLSAECL